MQIGTIEGTITLHDNFSGPLKAAQANLNAFGGNLRTLGKGASDAAAGTNNIGKSFDKFTTHIRNTLLHVGTAIVAYKSLAAAIESVGDSIEFERRMTQIGLVTETSAAEVAKFRANIDELVERTGRGPQELADGFYAVSSTVEDAALATEVLAESATLASMGLGETNDIARALAAAINSYGAENLSAAEAAAQLLAMVKAGGAEADQLAGSLGRVTALASEMGVSFAEVGAFVATFTKLGVGADEAVTSLRGTLADLLKPSVAGKEALDALGLSAEQLRKNIADNGLMETMRDLVGRAQSTSQLSVIIDNIRALTGVLATAGRQGDLYADVLKRIKTSEEQYAEAQAQLRKSVGFQWDQTRAQLEQLALTFGQQLLPAVQDFARVLTTIDPNSLADLGTTAADGLRILAGVVKLLVDNIDLLKAALLALLAFKIAAWAIAAEAGFYALASSMGAAVVAAGPLAIAIAALVGLGSLLNSKLKDFSREAQEDIEVMVNDTNRLGVAFQNLRQIVANKDTVTTSQWLDMQQGLNLANVELVEMQRQLKKLYDEGTVGNAQEIEQLKVKIANRQQEQEMLRVATSRVINHGKVVADVAAEVAKEPPLVPPPPDAAFMNKYAEAIARITDSIGVARETIANNRREHEEKLAQLRGQGAAHRQIEISMRTQAEIAKRIRALEDEKVQLTERQVQEISALITKEQYLLAVAEDIADQHKAFEQLLADSADAAADLADELRDVIAEQVQLGGTRMRDNITNSYAYQNTLLEKAYDWTVLMFDSWVTGGAAAVRIQEILAKSIEDGTNYTYAQAEAMVAVEQQMEKIAFWTGQVASLTKTTWQQFAEIALTSIDIVVDTFSSAFSQMAKDGKVEWKELWDSMVDSAIDMIIKMFADMLKRWLVMQAAMAATDYAGAGGGGGKGSKSAGDMVKDAGMNYGTTALMGGGASGGAAGAGLGGSNAYVLGGSGSAATSAMLGAGLAAFALYVVYKGFIEDHKKKFASVTLGGDSLSGVTTSNATWHGTKHLQGLQDSVSIVAKGMMDFLEAADIEMTKFASTTLTKQGEGYFVAGAGFIKDAGEAADVAIAYMIKYGEFADSVSLLVKTAIKSTKELSTQAIAANIEFARTLEDIGKSQIEINIGDIFQAFHSDFERVIDLFYRDTAAFVQAVTALGTHMSESLMDIYHDLTGTAASPEDQLAIRKRAAEMFNAQKKLMIAELGLKKIELQQKVDYLIASGRLLQANGDVLQAGLDQMRAYIEALGIIMGQLGEIPDINPEDVVIPGAGGGGGGGGGGNNRAQDILDLQRMLWEATATSYAQSVQAIIDKWAAAIPLAHDNVELLEQIADARQRELDLLKQQAIESAIDTARRFTGVRQDPFSQLRQGAKDAVKAIEDSPMANWQKAMRIADIWEAFGEQMRELADSMTLDLMGNLLADMEKFGATEKEMADMRRAWAILEHQIKLQNYKTEFELLKATGLLTEEQVNLISGAIAWLEGIDPTKIFGGGADPNDPLGGYTGGSSYEQWLISQRENAEKLAADERARALKLLEDWRNLGVHPLIKELREWQENSSFLTRVLGDNAEVQEAIARKYKDILDKYIDPIIEYLAGMDFDANSQLTGADQFSLAQQQFREMFAALQAGDLTQLDNVTEFAERYRQLAAGFTGGEGLRFIDKEIRDVLNAIVTMIPGFANTQAPIGSGLNPSVTVNPELLQAVQMGNTLLLEENRTQTVELRKIVNSNERIATSLVNPLTVAIM